MAKIHILTIPNAMTSEYFVKTTRCFLKPFIRLEINMQIVVWMFSQKYILNIWRIENLFFMFEVVSLVIGCMCCLKNVFINVRILFPISFFGLDLTLITKLKRNFFIAYYQNWAYHNDSSLIIWGIFDSTELISLI